MNTQVAVKGILAQLLNVAMVEQEGLPKQIVDIAWKAQLRLCKRYKKLINKGKHYNLVVTAIAREMIAYIWAIAKQIVLSPINPKLRLSRVPA